MTIIESVDGFQQEKIQELRKALGEQLLEETPLFNDDFSLLRWLIGWKYSIGNKNIKILVRLKKFKNLKNTTNHKNPNKF